MDQEFDVRPAIAAPAEERAAFLRRAAAWTFGGLCITALVSVFSALFIAPLILQTHWLVMLAVVYGSFILAQTVARSMVYGTAKVPGFVFGTAMQGVALGFLLLIAVVSSGTAAEGLGIIGTSLLLTLLSSAAMLMYVTIEKREFSLLRSGLAMATIPLLGLMVLQLIFPIGGTLGLIIAVVFVAVAVGSLLYKLNEVVHTMPTSMATEAGYELTLGIVVLFWNILSLLLRMRRR